ncbi:MAG: 1-phosphofructokinase [Clostridia bacterium]|nr:1-phosphofructokinase [Clostridia bacterium]
MIVTLTLNPSLDYTIRLDELRPGVLNRAKAEDLHPGGKGINVSRVLHGLGHESRALGFTAGFTGAEIERQLAQDGLMTDFVRTAGLSRINVKVKAGEETEINGAGPLITRDDEEKLFKKLDGLEEGDWLVLSGSVPRGLEKEVYARIMRRLRGKGIRIVADAEGEALRAALAEGPFLVKPNGSELAGLLGVPAATREEAVPCALRLREMGAENALISLGGEGAVLAAADGCVYTCPAPQGRVVDTVGAGDSMVAGFIAGWLESGSCRQALRTGVAAGSASAFSEGLATGEAVRRTLQTVAEAGKAETV